MSITGLKYSGSLTLILFILFFTSAIKSSYNKWTEYENILHYAMYILYFIVVINFQSIKLPFVTTDEYWICISC